MQLAINQVKKGEFFTLTEIETPSENQVYIRGDYDRSSKTYSCCKFSDVNSEKFFKGTKKVFTGFTF